MTEQQLSLGSSVDFNQLLQDVTLRGWLQGSVILDCNFPRNEITFVSAADCVFSDGVSTFKGKFQILRLTDVGE